MAVQAIRRFFASESSLASASEVRLKRRNPTEGTLNMSQSFNIRSAIGSACSVALAALLSLASAYGQSYEITPLFGGRFGGTVELEQAGVPHYDAHVADSFNFGLAGGIRFSGGGGEGHDAIEFRWMRQSSHLTIPQNVLVPTPYASGSSRPSVSINHFLGDFSHEFDLQEAPMIQPFVRASLGAALLSTPASSATRFAFGLATGMKVFPRTNWGVRVELEYLPTVMTASAQNVVCAGGGCVAILKGGIMNQFQVSVGPSFRF